ncbi:MAG: hypothetical protein NVS4B12_01410 [Ktedonobacteraceae bacterium]
MGILARHVAFNGEWPIFFYGLPYLGPLEGYIAAPLFHLSGSSTFILRLALLPFFALFLLCMYYLTRLLYTSRLAIFTVVLLCFGSEEILRRQLRAVGEYPETLFFAAFISLVVSWLVLSTHEMTGKTRTTPRRIFVYGVLGLVVGCALWVDFLILPFLGTASILLLLFCRRELVSWAGLSLLVGLLIGAFPLLYYNITAPLSSNSIAILLSIQHSGASQHHPFLQQIVGTLMISLPNATGFTPLCPDKAFPYFRTANMYCVVLQGGWGLGYLFLWAFATCLTVCVIWRGWKDRASLLLDDRGTERQNRVRQYCRLMLLVSAGGTILLYAISPAAAVFPGPTARYLVCVLVATPALCWPLWNSGETAKASLQRRTHTYLFVRRGVLFLLLTLFVMGTFLTFLQVPAAEAAYAQQNRLVQRLLTLHATRIYSEYWTCNRLIFQSEEKIICSALEEKLNPGFDRYTPYRDIVKASPLPAYVFPLGFQQIAALDVKMNKDSQFNSLYQRQVFEGYVLYVPKVTDMTHT